MLYLRAALDGLARADGDAKPAGVFYFEIADPLVDITGVPSAATDAEDRQAWRLAALQQQADALAFLLGQR